MIDPATAAATATAAPAAGPSLSTIFWAAAVDTLLFAWMHFTPSGMAFGASVAAATGMTPSVTAATAAGATSMNLGGISALAL